MQLSNNFNLNPPKPSPKTLLQSRLIQKAIKLGINSNWPFDSSIYVYRLQMWYLYLFLVTNELQYVMARSHRASPGAIN